LFGCEGDLVRQQRLEWLGEFTPDLLGVVYVNLLKDCLVELSPDDCGGFEVGGMPVGGEVEGLCEVGIGLVELDVDSLEAGFCGFERSGDAGLFVLEQFEGTASA